MGGYASFPICIAASILRIKFVIYENNLIIGRANKKLLPFAEKILVYLISFDFFFLSINKIIRSIFVIKSKKAFFEIFFSFEI